MISEKTFARGYSSFWTEFTPWIQEYVSYINKGEIQRKFRPINSLDISKFRSINNTAASIHFKNRVNKGNTDLEIVLKEAENFLKFLPKNELESYILNEINSQIIIDQSNRLFEIFEQFELSFDPKFKGCGIIANCNGDLYYDNVLCEIKAGERNIKSADLKQLIIYCALNWLSEDRITIDHIEIFNPRQGIYWTSSLKEVIRNISILPLEDLFEELGYFVSTSSEEIII